MEEQPFLAGKKQRHAIERGSFILDLYRLICMVSASRDVSSHVIYLHKGLIEEEGPPNQVFGAPKSDRCKQFVSGIH